MTEPAVEEYERTKVDLDRSVCLVSSMSRSLAILTRGLLERLAFEIDVQLKELDNG